MIHGACVEQRNTRMAVRTRTQVKASHLAGAGVKVWPVAAIAVHDVNVCVSLVVAARNAVPRVACRELERDVVPVQAPVAEGLEGAGGG